MLSLPPSVKIYLAAQPVDMRKSFDALANLVRSHFDLDPMSGHLFVFLGRRRHIARILFWDRTGYAIFTKRLERGTFVIPDHLPPGVRQHPIDSADLLLLLEGIDLNGARRRPRWKQE